MALFAFALLDAIKIVKFIKVIITKGIKNQRKLKTEKVLKSRRPLSSLFSTFLANLYTPFSFLITVFYVFASQTSAANGIYNATLVSPTI